MAKTAKILAFAGTLRKDGYNKRLARIAADAAREAGAEVTFVDLKDLPMPVYDGDLEEAEGMPENARKFKELLRTHQGFLISTGEYNSSITGALKNAIDWASREETDDEPPLVAFKGKVAGLLSASPGALGGLRALVHVRAILENIGTLVVPEQFALSKAHEAFAEDGKLKEAKQLKSVRGVVGRVVDVVSKLN